MGRIIDLTGQRFGRLVVLRRDEHERYVKWLCQCDCGNKSSVQTHALRSGAVKSCGCLKAETLGAIMKTHGESGSRLYKVWRSMITRCTNPNSKSYANYGGRGITVCDEWKEDFTAFRNWALLSGYDKDAPHGFCTLDRINNERGYSPENCRWASREQQVSNQRRNHYITYQGKTQTITQWSKQFGLSKGVLYHRLKIGWDIETALNTPISGKKANK